jgi:hypothetical protein
MPGRFGFVDRVLPDGVVERAYANGRVERRVWKAQVPDVIAWSDNAGNMGRDRDLGGGRVERTEANGTVLIGQQVGHGITSWNNGQYVTVNETPLPEPPPPPPTRPGGLAGLLMALGIGGLFGLGGAALLRPGDDVGSAEAMLYDEMAMQEEEVRRAARQQQAAGSSSSSGSDGGGGDGGGGDWDNDGEGGDDNGVDSFG